MISINPLFYYVASGPGGEIVPLLASSVEGSIDVIVVPELLPGDFDDIGNVPETIWTCG